MKLTVGKRILMFFHWLLSALICAAFAAYLIKPEFVKGLYDKVTARLTATQITIIGIAILAVYVIVAIAELYLVFHRGKKGDRGFITVDSSDTGKVRIAVSAIEQMVRQSVTSIDGINEMKIGIQSLDDAIKIDIAANIYSGSHVPTITMNMQRAIRQFVEMNCGVAVRAVSISINSVTNATEPKGRKGRGRRDAAPVMPSPDTVTATRPVEPGYTPAEPAYAPAEPAYTPVEEPKPAEPTLKAPWDTAAQAPETSETPAYEEDVPEIPDEPRPIRLTLDYDNAPEAPEAAFDEEAE